VITIFFNLLWFHAVKSGLLDAAAIESASGISRRYGIPSLFSFVWALNDADCNEIVAFLDSPSVR